MIFTSSGKRLTILECTDIINSGERLIMFLYEDEKWYKYNYVSDAWYETNIDISIDNEV